MQLFRIMKRLKTAFFVFFLILLNFSSVLMYGAPKPGQPRGPMDPPNEELPIDDHIVFLVIFAIVLGIIIIYRNKIKKASI